MKKRYWIIIVLALIAGAIWYLLNRGVITLDGRITEGGGITGTPLTDITPVGDGIVVVNNPSQQGGTGMLQEALSDPSGNIYVQSNGITYKVTRGGSGQTTTAYYVAPEPYLPYMPLSTIKLSDLGISTYKLSAVLSDLSEGLKSVDLAEVVKDYSSGGSSTDGSSDGSKGGEAGESSHGGDSGAPAGEAGESSK